MFAHLGVFAGGGALEALQAVVGAATTVRPALEALAEASLIGLPLDTAGTRSMFRALNDSSGAGNTLLNLGLATGNLGDPTGARWLLADSVAAFREIGHKPGIALVLFNLGNLDLDLDDLEAAQARYEESLALAEALGQRADASYALFGLGDVAYRRGDLDLARARMGASLALRYETGEKRPIARNLEGIAALDRAGGLPERAVRLLAAAATLRESLGLPVDPGPGTRATLDLERATLRTTLGERAFESAWAAGAAMSAEETLALALGWPASKGRG